MREIPRIPEKLKEEKNRRNELKQAVTDSYNAYEELEPEVHAAHQMVSQLKNQLRGIQGKIRSMESSSGNSLEIFGQRCSKVKQMVDKAIQSQFAVTRKGRVKNKLIDLHTSQARRDFVSASIH